MKQIKNEVMTYAVFLTCKSHGCETFYSLTATEFMKGI